MATIVVVPSGVTSKRLLAGRLADALADHGHRVVWADDGQRDDAPVRASIERVDRRLHVPEDRTRRRWRPIRHLRATWDLADSLDVAGWLSVVDAHGPDLVLIDIEEHAPFIAVRSERPAVRVAVINSFFDIWPGPQSPPLDAALVPTSGVAGRLRVRAAWAASRAAVRWRDLRHHLAGRKVEPASVTRRLVRRFDVAGEVTRRAWLHPVAPSTVPILSLVAPSLDLPSRRPAHDRAVGPLLDELSDTSLTEVASSELAAFVARAAADAAPLVVVASGGFVAGDADGFGRRVLAAAERLPALRFVVAGSPETIASPNVHVEDWIPQRELLVHASLAVVHSGTGTLHECVAAGVPMAVYPFAVNDQAGNAARVTFHGVGRVGERASVSVEQLVDDISTLADDDGLRSRVGRLREAVRAESDPGVAVRAVEAVLAAGRHVSDSPDS
ncbi:MAG: nucleotide disphospho-sugar-binding domain-containing protein [Actinomycetota bacterium]